MNAQVECYGLKFVPSHLGQGGKVSVSSSSITVCPQFVHVYVPFPGFSPVVDIFPPFNFDFFNAELKVSHTPKYRLTSATIDPTAQQLFLSEFQKKTDI